MPELLINLLTSWTLHILYNTSHWQLRILDFGAPKKLSLGGGGSRPCPSPGHHATVPKSKSALDTFSLLSM